MTSPRKYENYPLARSPRGRQKVREDSSAPDSPQLLRIEPQRLHWAVFDAPPLSRWGRAGLYSARDLEALRYAFEPWIPAPLDEIETRFSPLGPGSKTIIACGIERDRLTEMLSAETGEGDPGAGSIESARPACVPEPALRRTPGLNVAADGAEQADALLARLEFCSGPFTGSDQRRLRRRLLIGALASTLLGSALITLAMLRAAGDARAAGDEARAASASIAVAALSAVDAGTGRGSAPGAETPWELRLEAAVRSLERTRLAPTSGPGLANRSPSASPMKQDRGGLFIAMLSVWPEQFPVRVESLQIEQASATIRGQTRSAAEAEALLLAIDGVQADAVSETGPGLRWSVQSRSLGRSGEAATFTAVLAPLAAEVGPAAPSPAASEARP